MVGATLELGANIATSSHWSPSPRRPKNAPPQDAPCAVGWRVFARRFPCLAAQPAFLAPLADARGVVQELARGAPPSLARVSTCRPPGSRRPSGVADGASRSCSHHHGPAVKTRRDCVVAPAAARRCHTYPGRGGPSTYDGIDLEEDRCEPIGSLGSPWRTARTEDEHRDLMRQILQLPAEIALDLDAGTAGRRICAALVETTCRLVDARLRQRFSSLPATRSGDWTRRGPCTIAWARRWKC